MSSEKIEDAIRNVRLTTSAATDERIMAAAEAAMAKPNEQQPARIGMSGQIRRIIMKSKWTKLATAAAVIAAIMFGMHALTGSGTSITIAQVRQAMQEIDWMQIILTSKLEKGTQTEWVSFASKVQIGTHFKLGIDYNDFKTRRQLNWPGTGKYIYESTIDETTEFAYGAGGPFEMVDKTLRLAEAEQGSNVVRELGTYEGRKVEVWTVSNVKRGSPQTLTAYIDVDRKLPVAATYQRTGTDHINPEDNYIRFKYPKTGPADIYEAGAPRSAQIKPESNP